MVTPNSSSTDKHDRAELPLARALQLITQALQPVSSRENVTLRGALDRVLAEEIISPINVPGHTQATRDGYALRSQDIPATKPHTLKIIATALAGQPYTGEIQGGECVQIMTGAVLPTGADTVVMQEHIERLTYHIRVLSALNPGENIRYAGADIPIGHQVLSLGRRLTPADIGLLASLGLAEVAVWRRLRIALFSTGDELCSVGEKLGRGQIYDSNRYTLYAMLQRLNSDIMDMGVIPDQPDALKEALITAANNADVIVSSGGISVGQADYVKEALENTGTIGFWKIALKPGRPLAFGQVKEALFFGLPGNPVSAMVTFYQCVQPALLQLMGQTPSPSLTIKVLCRSPLQKSPGRMEYQRGILTQDKHGQLIVETTGQQDSGILTSMSKANCFIILPSESSDIPPDTWVEVQPFVGLV